MPPLIRKTTTSRLVRLSADHQADKHRASGYLAPLGSGLEADIWTAARIHREAMVGSWC